ncbi:MAG: methylated-DNA--[protein]-cysteine S-methyltransferase [Mycobacteriaceae bacterium]|nr:methylated-DNA--[protein]-cysteine S-methyltransferase [Mycobacteriaceae bacterium]
MNIRHCVIESQLGELTLVADGNALTGVYFRQHWHRPDPSTFGARVAAHRADFDLPVSPHGDRRQRRVWNLVTDIPFGGTVTYGELATALAEGTTPQEVGQAVGRVVGRNGQLTGYAGGLKRKQFLLALEEAADVKAARLF